MSGDREGRPVTAPAPPLTTLAHGGTASEIESFIRGLGYNDQLHLLVWLCQADPELAACGAAALIEYHAAAAGRRKARSKEKYRERRRRQRRQQSAAVA